MMVLLGLLNNKFMDGKFEMPPEPTQIDPMEETENQIEKKDINTTKRIEGHEKPKKQSLIKKALKKIGMVGALVASLTAGAEAQKKPVDDPFATESLHRVSRQYKPTEIVSGHRYRGLTNLDDAIALGTDRGSDVSLAIQHNIKRPESFADIGKMIVEPVSVSLSFPYGKDNLVAKVKTRLGYKDGETQIVDIEIPYRYAQKFDTANPKNQEEMKKQAMEDAQKLFDKIMTSVFGPSFFKKEAVEHHREFSSPLTQVNSMHVEGYASPESTQGVNLDDIRNQKLSKLRAENATETIRELFKRENVGVENVTFHGGGEEALSQDELKRLASEAVKIDLSDPSDSQSSQVLKIIKEYNNGSITEESALKLLDETVGSKRKVAVHLEVNEEKKVLIIPLPLLLFLWPAIKKLVDKYREFEDRRKYKSSKRLPHSFIRSEDHIPEIATDGEVKFKDNETINSEAGKFFAGYTHRSDSFFIVSSDDQYDLETANIYRQVAQRQGLEVVKPEHSRGDVDDQTGGYIRIIKSLSTDPEKTQEEMYEREFKNLIRLLNFGEKKIKENEDEQKSDVSPKTIHILAFGHGDLVQHALSKYFSRWKYPMARLEVIQMSGTKNPNKAKVKYRLDTKKIR